MAQTFLNLAQGVTGTLPTSNYDAKIGQLKNQVLTTAVTIATDSGTGTATGLTLAITPTATSSKIFIIPNLAYKIDTDGRGFGIKMFRTVGGSATEIFDANYKWLGIGVAEGGSAERNRATWHHLDTPNTSSEIVYSVNALSESGNAIYLQPNTTESMFTLMEVLQ